MDQDKSEGITKKVLTFLFMVFGSLGLAVLIVAGLLYYYSPSGRYIIKNTLISPSTIQELTGNDSKKGRGMRFVFDEIKFSYYDEASKAVKMIAVAPANYHKFYRLIENDESIVNVSEAQRAQFSSVAHAILLISATIDGEPTNKISQEVEILKTEDLYRIRLREQKSSDPWAYFQHPGIYSEAVKALAG